MCFAFNSNLDDQYNHFHKFAILEYNCDQNYEDG